MINAISKSLVLIAGLYFIALGFASLFVPEKAKKFLLGFAGSARVHYIELFLRILVGGALIMFSPHMLYSNAFSLFGWILVITTTGLLLVPWRWHQKFAQQTVPTATRFIVIIGVFSLALGCVILAAIILGSKS